VDPTKPQTLSIIFSPSYRWCCTNSLSISLTCTFWGWL